MPYGTVERPSAACLLCEDAVPLGRDVLLVSRPVPGLPPARRAEPAPPEDGGWLLELHQDDGEVVRVLFAEEEEV